MGTSTACDVLMWLHTLAGAHTYTCACFELPEPPCVTPTAMCVAQQHTQALDGANTVLRLRSSVHRPAPWCTCSGRALCLCLPIVKGTHLGRAPLCMHPR